MKQFLVTLPRNLIGCFKGRKLVWHLVAILLTVILVMSGFDWRYFLATRNPALRSWMLPAVIIGGLLPIYLPLIASCRWLHCPKCQDHFDRLGHRSGRTPRRVDCDRLQSIYRPRPSGAQRRRGHQPCLPLRLFARRSFLGLAIVAYHHRLCHGHDGVHALSKTTVAGVGGDSLRFLHRHWRLHDHPLVLGFRGGSHYWHRSSGPWSGRALRETFNVSTPEVTPERGD